MLLQKDDSGNPGEVRGLKLLRAAYLLIALVTPVFIIAVWHESKSGVPYFKDSNESYHTYIHARNMQWHGFASSWLTDEANNKEARPHTYTHNPNLPRYFAFVLRLVGIRNVGTQTLVLALAASILSAILIYRFLSEWPGLLLIFGLFFCTDFFGHLQYAANSYRAWHFPLLFGCFAFTLRRNAIGSFVAFFLLFQLEYTFAVFTAVATATALIIEAVARRDLRPVKILLWAAAGAVVSMAVFVGQLTSFYGIEGLVDDLRYTVHPAEANPEVYAKFHVMRTSSPAMGFQDFLAQLSVQVNGFYTPFIVRLVEGSVIVSLVLVVAWIIRGSRDDDKAARPAIFSVAAYVLGMALGVLVVGAMLPGYTANAYLSYFFPMVVFLLGLGLSGLCYFCGILLLRPLPGSWRVAAGCVVFPALVAVGFIPWMKVSLENHRVWPLIDGAGGRKLEEFAGNIFVTVCSWQMVSAHTDAPCADMSLGNIDELVAKTPRYRFASYFFIQNTYHWNPPLDVSGIVKRLTAAGHELVAGDANYAIVKLNWQ